jgi:hypothetical protein
MSLMTYFWQANLAWLLLYAIYWAFLRRDTFFRWNRFYLLAASIFALAFPFLPIPTLLQDAVPEDQVLLFFGGNEAEIPLASTEKTETDTVFTWENSLLALYFAGVIFLLIRLIFSLFSIAKLIFVHGIRRMKEGYLMVQTKAKTPIFSFMNILFWNEPATVSEEEKAKILAHELVHIRQWHSLDVLFMEILAIIFWCNPVAWAYRKSLQAIHEYLADAKVLNKGMSKTEYANLLVSQFLHTDTLYLTNHFLNKSLLKNRIMMIHQKKSNQKAFVKFAAVLPILAVCLLIAACSKELNNIQIAQFDMPKGFETQQKYTISANKEIVIDMDSTHAYMLRMSNSRNNYQGVILTLYNPKNEEVATSKVNSRYFNGFTYRCTTQGKYRLLTTMEKGADEETVVALASRKSEPIVDRRRVSDVQTITTQINQTFELNHQKHNQCTVYAYLEGQEDTYKDYYVNVFKPNGERIGVAGYENKGRGNIFSIQESGTYRVEVVPTKGKFPENMKLRIDKRYFEKREEAKVTPATSIEKTETSPYSGFKEYEAPVGKTAEYTMILSKDMTYSFRMMKGSAKLEIKNKEGELIDSAESEELVIKKPKTGIYNLFITPKGSDDAKVTFSFMKE